MLEAPAANPPRRRCAARARRAAHLAIVAGVLLAFAPRAWAAPGEAVLAPSSSAKYGHFDDVLERHGQWLEVAKHRRAWRPSGVEEGWRPYLHGSWTFTEDGWFWVTDEPWGAVTYHYGRWSFDGAYGWVWFPGRTWAPAWVAWRWDAEVVGWAPLPPDGRPGWAFWTFVPAARFVGERADAVALPGALVPALLTRTRHQAPDPAHLARAAGVGGRKPPNPTARRAG